MAINFDYLLDLFLPKYCLVCNKLGALMCQRCLGKISFNYQRVDFLASEFEYFFALTDYNDHLAAQSIKLFKYQFITDLLEEFWQPALANFWQANQELLRDDYLLVPVPLHYKKQLRRGFNQSELIAQKISRLSGYKVSHDLLLRIKNNPAQASSSAQQRQKNIRGIFKINYRSLSDAWGQKILLIDDVSTTGSTLKECAQVLRGQGFLKISALVLSINK